MRITSSTPPRTLELLANVMYTSTGVEEELFASFGRFPRQSSLWGVHRSVAVDFPSRFVRVDPLFPGLWLADGI
jgi:hypothetical protein